MVVAISTGQKDCDFGGCGWYLRMSLSLNAQRCCSGDSEMVLPQHTSRNEQRCSGELCLLPTQLGRRGRREDHYKLPREIDGG